ncbi:hypothetical protein BT67DRAFT_424893 [Trichocladium antarcticum]|uniref:Uncharacterized protein n=1 Tax=Trichocladium antarcticum TaxID=1450529 RepID=A0AAN6UGT7_9PEZI|nr:hypothetical protein BT67DRAFT_424893 [Trichocladium antarcticum]
MERGARNPNYPADPSQPAHQPKTYGQSPASGPAPKTAGPHKHDILNKLDPRIDSTHDREPAAAAAAAAAAAPSTQPPSTGHTIPEGTYGPHSSRAANALDPRVDSDLDRSRHTGTGTATGTGTGTGAGVPGMAIPAAAVPAATYGRHGTRAANVLDPHVDSGMDNQRAQHSSRGALETGAAGGAAGAAGMGMSAGSGSGGAGGPHRSEVANKLDPRVDSSTGAWKADERGS